MTLSSCQRMLAALGLAVLGCSCQQHILSTSRSGGAVGTRTYHDSVVHLGQVDPAYRPYFQSQQGANYSLEDQRKAYLAAAQTARTPVRETDYRPGDIRKKKLAVAPKKRSAKSPIKKRTAAKKPAGSKKKS